jgi:hypothetical protein
MNIKYLLAILTVFIIACESKYTYWETSKFNMVPSALEDDEEIKLIYSSRGPGNNKDLSIISR